MQHQSKNAAGANCGAFDISDHAGELISPESNVEASNNQDDIDRVAEIERIAALDELDYQANRARLAKRLGIRASALDRLVAACRKKLGLSHGEESKGQGSIVELREPSSWPEPVRGALIADALACAIRNYVILPAWCSYVIALWILHTYALDRFSISPRLAITSPQPGCGKTTLLDVIFRLVWRPLFTSNASASTIFRIVEAERPCLLIDEGDTFLKDKEDLRGILNSGHRRGGAVLRTIGDDHEVRSFSTFSAAAIAMIGKMHATLEDRSVSIEMARRKPGEDVLQFRYDQTEDLDRLASMARRFMEDNAHYLPEIDPNTHGLSNRPADNWRPLLAIAELIGDRWPAIARDAALIANQREKTETSGGMLLADIAAIFNERKVDRISSADLANTLATMEGRPWAEFGRSQKPITPNALARALSAFGIAPGGLRLDDRTPRGYQLQQFADAFERYLGQGDSEPQQRNNPDEMGTSSAFQSATGSDVLHSESGEKPLQDNACGGVAVADTLDDAFEERAAILQFDGGLSRSEAEEIARREAQS